ncbi:MAG: MauE/DoxX family redox-associated membrane protein [Ilumatobacteraceae bacterium]
MTSTHRSVWPVAAVVLGGFIGVAGVAHFVNPDFFDAIVPPWLPPGERFWTYASGVVELAIAPMLLVPRWRRIGGLAALALFVGVYPANLYMAWDWRDRTVAEQLVAYGRLPFQFVFIWLAWRISRHAAAPVRRSPSAP